MTTLILIEGTWAGQWAIELGPGTFRHFLTAQGFTCQHFHGWSRNPDGIPSLLDADGNEDWKAGGYALRYFLEHFPYEERNILCHSHGIAPVIYQATLPDQPLAVRRVLSVCSPPRKDLEAVGQVAINTQMFGHWRHIFASGWDGWARFGQMFDGHWGWRRNWQLHAPAGVFNQVGERGIGHSGLFTPEERQRFVDGGHFDFLHAR